MSIIELQKGEKGKVVEILGGLRFRIKLDSLGIREGIVITKISESIARGPVVLQIGNSKVAIGFGMAKRIIVEKI